MKLYETMTNEKIGERVRELIENGYADSIKIEMMSEVKPKKKVPRISTINTVKEFIKARKELKDYCSTQNTCYYCPRYKESAKYDSCFNGYMAEEIEVDDDGDA